MSITSRSQDVNSITRSGQRKKDASIPLAQQPVLHYERQILDVRLLQTRSAIGVGLGVMAMSLGG